MGDEAEAPSPVKLEGLTLKPFNPNIEMHNIGTRWTRWVRSFTLFVTGKGIADPEQKKALLLHTAGVDVQDVYFSLPNIDREPEGTDTVYDVTLAILNDHFKPRVNIPVERAAFRSMVQTPSETVDQYITRLRQKAVLCNFPNLDDELRDQVLEKCVSKRLRRKLLDIENLTLEKLQTAAKNFERNEQHMLQGELAETTPEAGKLYQVKSKFSAGKGTGITSQNTAATKTCFSCGRRGHVSKDPTCPAREKKCYKCKNVGHFADRCKTRTKSHGSNPSRGGHCGKGRGNMCNYVDPLDSDEYAFSVNDNKSNNEKIGIQVGGNDIEVIIDSGAAVNIIDSEMWNKLKSNKIKCVSEKTDKRLFAYGSEKPLNLLGKFTTQVSLKDSNVNIESDFYVMQDRGPALLGKDTATIGKPCNYCTQT